MAYVRKQTKNGVTYELTQLAENVIGAKWVDIRTMFDTAAQKNTGKFEEMHVICDEGSPYIELVGVNKVKK